MEEDEDDLYGQQTAPRQNGHSSVATSREPANTPHVKEEGEEMDEDADEDDNEDEDDDSESDIDIITERKPNSTKPDPSSQPSSRLEPPKLEHTRSASTASDKAGSKPPTSGSEQPQGHQKYSAPQSSKPGTDYPAIHSSALDINGADPDYETPNGTTKPLTELDFDADLAEHSKPWRLPGTDQTEYFNYGFDEFTWATYCLKQKTMRDGIVEQKAESAKFEMMFGGVPPGMPGQPQPGPPAGPQAAQQGQAQQQQQQPQVPVGMPAMPAMPGMPEMSPDMMNQMMQQMMASGVDPAQMDFGTFMQQFQAMQGGPGMAGGPGMGGPANMGGPPQGPQGQHGYGGQGQGYGGGGGGQRRGQGRRW